MGSPHQGPARAGTVRPVESFLPHKREGTPQGNTHTAKTGPRGTGVSAVTGWRGRARKTWVDPPPTACPRDKEGGLGGKLPEGDENEDPWPRAQPHQAVPALRPRLGLSHGAVERSRGVGAGTVWERAPGNVRQETVGGPARPRTALGRRARGRDGTPLRPLPGSVP